MSNPSQTLIRPEIATSSTVTTVTEEAVSQASQPPVAVLKLRKPRLDKKVEWTNDTVDNENMNKKKSKCCCIFEKKRNVGESDSEGSDDECENCSGHVQRKKHHPTAPHPTPGENTPQTL